MIDDRLQHVLLRIYEADWPDRNDLVKVLELTDQVSLDQLFAFADMVRSRHVGDGILVRGIVEFSSYCRNSCYYCGLNKNNKSLQRYRLTDAQILQAVESVYDSGIRTVVLQSGEDDQLDIDSFADLISKIKQKCDMAVTLSLGEYPQDAYRKWKQAGADRYLLKIETSDSQFYSRFHPGMSFDNRVECLRNLKALGYQTGSGCLVGLKGQTVESLADDILFFKKYDFDMIGIGLFIPHKQTQLRDENHGDLMMTLKVLALTRIVLKNSHLPATTATASFDGQDHRLDALRCGGNVIMPNFTPSPYKQLYEIYPNKRCVDEQIQTNIETVEAMAEQLGRYVDYTRGDSLKS